MAAAVATAVAGAQPTPAPIVVAPEPTVDVEAVIATRVAEQAAAIETAVAAALATPEPEETPEDGGGPGGVCSRGGANELAIVLGGGALLGLVLRRRLVL